MDLSPTQLLALQNVRRGGGRSRSKRSRISRFERASVTTRILRGLERAGFLTGTVDGLFFLTHKGWLAVGSEQDRIDAVMGLD